MYSNVDYCIKMNTTKIMNVLADLAHDILLLIAVSLN